MDDFNPYRSPDSPLIGKERPNVRGLVWLYQVPNILYAVFVVLSTVGLVVVKPDMFMEAVALPALMIIYAPILCFVLVRWGAPRFVRIGLGLQVIVVFWIVYLLIGDWVEQREDIIGGCVYLAINLLALFGGLLQARVRSLSKEPIDVYGKPAGCTRPTEHS